MASISFPCPKISSSPRLGSTNANLNHQIQKISFPIDGYQCLSRKQSAVWKQHAQNCEVVSNSAPIAGSSNGKAESAGNRIPDGPALAAFMSHVSDLVKLVDSRDIVELQLKQLDCEIVIKKKDATEQPAAAPMYTMQQPMYQSFEPTPQAAAPAAAPPALSAPAPAPAPAKVLSSKSIKCPMAGTFYRCPGPGEPPFVKVGDKVTKGQVVCIIEAMKLMNEIEADQSGTVVDILVDDAKPVSVDTPLFAIAP